MFTCALSHGSCAHSPRGHGFHFVRLFFAQEETETKGKAVQFKEAGAPATSTDEAKPQATDAEASSVAAAGSEPDLPCARSMRRVNSFTRI